MRLSVPWCNLAASGCTRTIAKSYLMSCLCDTLIECGWDCSHDYSQQQGSTLLLLPVLAGEMESPPVNACTGNANEGAKQGGGNEFGVSIRSSSCTQTRKREWKKERMKERKNERKKEWKNEQKREGERVEQPLGNVCRCEVKSTGESPKVQRKAAWHIEAKTNRSSSPKRERQKHREREKKSTKI